jgi:hypothetical protein
MARGAYALGVTVVGREPRVVERGSRPGGCRVASLAGGWESRRLVIRIGRALVIGLVTAVAICRHARVVVVHVATGTGDCGMSPRERERRVVVIERRRLPRRGRVAQFTLLRKSRGNVIGVGGPLKILQVTRNAGRVGKTVVVVDVAGRTRHVHVRAR